MNNSTEIHADDAVYCDSCDSLVHEDDAIDLGECYQCVACGEGDEAAAIAAMELAQHSEEGMPEFPMF